MLSLDRPLRRAVRCWPLLAPALLLAACDASDPASGGAHAEGVPAPFVPVPTHFVFDPVHESRTPAPRVAEITWGRLVDVHAVDASGAALPVLSDLLVGPQAGLDGGPIELQHDPLTGRERLKLPFLADSPQFLHALEQARAAVVTLHATDEQAWLRAPETQVPPDAVISVRFDQALLAPADLASASLELLADGHWSAVKARRLVDRHHGARIAGGFAPTRILLDPSVTPFEAGTLGCAHPGASPCSTSTCVPSALPGADSYVSSWLSGTYGAFGTAMGASFARVSLGGSAAPARVFSVGGTPLALGVAPEVIGEQTITLVRVDDEGGGLFTLGWIYATPDCQARLEPGDLVQVGQAMLEVQAGPTTPIYKRPLAAVGRVSALLLVGPPSQVVVGPARLLVTFDPGLGDLPECFVRISPTPSAPPAAGVAPDATFSVRFSAPMDPASVQALGTFQLSTLEPVASPLHRRIVSVVIPASGGMEWTLAPVLALDHAAGGAERYLLETEGMLPLGTLPLAHPLPPIQLTLDPAAPARSSRNLSLSFESTDEDGDGAPEMRGQFLHDLQAGALAPRPVTRFSTTVDSSQAVVAAMTPWIAPVQTPLVPLGSRAMSAWRYHDLGLALLDEAGHNLDVEGLAWSPGTVSVLIDSFPEFRMALAHSSHLPDEYLQPATLLPQFPASGLETTFVLNVLGMLQVVHPKAAGYVINPLDSFLAATGTLLHPWPLNRGIPPSQFAYFTWRDTSETGVAAPGGSGADTARLLQVTGTGLVGFYPAGQVPTIGLPLLTEFRTYPNAGALGLNGLRTALAINSSSAPSFRAFSSGGVLTTGTKIVDPDSAQVANGGVAGGAATPPLDNIFHLGQADFVTRVSRAHTRWLDTASAAPMFAPAVVERQLPAGTQIAVAWRGADAFTGPATLPWNDARSLDAYGSSFTPAQLAALGLNPAQAFTPQFHGGDPTWKALPSELDGARYLQGRVSFVANAVSGETARLTGLGLAFRP